MTKTKSPNPPLHPVKTYKRNFKCNNCKGKTNCPAWLASKIYCQKCMVYRRTNLKQFPTLEIIQRLKDNGLWKK